jgi:hypothetical protein
MIYFRALFYFTHKLLEKKTAKPQAISTII